MNELPPELIDVCFKYVSNANLYKMYLTSWECHVLSSLHLKHCKYAIVANKEEIKFPDLSQGGKPIDYVAYRGDLQGVKYLRSIGKEFSQYTMERAACNGHLKVVKYLYSIEKDPIGKKSFPKMYMFESIFGNAAAYGAAAYGHLEVVKYLHSIGKNCTDIAADNVACYGHLEVLKYLHSIGIGKNSCVFQISWAAQIGHLEMVKYLHSTGKSGSDDIGMYPAASHGHLEIVKYLHSIGVKGKVIKDAMGWAANSGHWEVVKFLKSIKK